PTTFTGGAERARTNASTDQPPSTARTAGFDRGAGTSYVNPDVNAWRISKSELPRSMFGFASVPGVFNLVAKASVDELSIECEYDASACKPRANRLWNLV